MPGSLRGLLGLAYGMAHRLLVGRAVLAGAPRKCSRRDKREAFEHMGQCNASVCIESLNGIGKAGIYRDASAIC